MNYAGFWRRCGAFWIDFIVLLPLMGITLYGIDNSRLFQVYWLVPGALIGLWFSVYLVIRYGGTPGKLALRTKIVMDDGTPVTVKAAMIRHVVLFVLSFVTSAALAYACFFVTDEEYAALTLVQKSELLTKLAPDWYGLANILMNIWIWSEFLTVLFNKRRKAIHDYLAGTVVIRR